MLTLAAPDARSETEADALRTLDTANGLLGRGLYELAIPEYETFLRDHPRHPEADVARYALGVCHSRRGEYEAAIGALDDIRSERAFAYGAEAALIRADAMTRLGRHRAAVRGLEKMLETWPDHPSASDASALLIEALSTGGNHEAAVAAAESFVERWPGHANRARVELFQAMSLAALGRDADAAGVARGVVRRADDPAMVRAARLIEAQSLHASGDMGAAAIAYRAVIESSEPGADGAGKERGDALLGLGQVQRVRGELADAARALEAYLDCCADGSPAADGARLELALVRFDAERFEETIDLARRVARGDDASLRDDAAYWEAKSLLRLGRDREAAAALDGALRSFENSELASAMAYDHGVALWRAGDRDGARRAFAHYRERYPDADLVPEAMHAEASLALEARDYKGARRVARDFLRAHTDDHLAPAILFIAGEAAYLDGDYADAARAFEGVLSDGVTQDESRAERARYRLGMSLVRLGRADEARALLESVVGAGAAEGRYRPALAALGDQAFERGEWRAAESWFTRYLNAERDTDEGRAAPELKLGLALARQERHAEAIERFEVLLAADTSGEIGEQAMFERGQCLMAMGRDADAERAFRQLVERNDESRFTPYAMRHVGTLAMRRGDAEEAAKWFAGAAGTHRSAAGDGGAGEIALEARYDRARALLETGDERDALRELESLLRSEGVGRDLRSRSEAARAVALARLGNHEAAIGVIGGLESDALDEATRRMLAYERASSLRALGRSDEAARAFTLVRQGGTGDEFGRHATLELASIEMDRGAYEPAADLLDALLDAPDSAGAGRALAEAARYRRGVCAHRLGDHEGVVEALGAFRKSYPDSTVADSADLLCGEALATLVRRRDATEYLARAAREGAPDEVRSPALLRLGGVMGELQDWEGSREAYGAFLEGFESSDQWFRAGFGLGWALENEGDHEAAIEVYRDVVERHDGETAARAQFQIGECLFAIGRHAEAVRELMRVEILYAYPTWSAAALFEAGRCFEAMSKIGEARAQYRRVVEEFGETTWAAAAEERLGRLAGGALPGRGNE